MQKFRGIFVLLVLLSGTFSTNLAFADSPAITIQGDNPATVFVGDTYSDAGATASDTEDDDATLIITTTNNVDTTTPGSYTVDYSVTDSDGNTTMESRTVNVVTNDSPVITIQGPDSKATQMSIVIDTLTGLKDTTDDKTDKKIDKVIKKINKAMNSKYWDESGNELTSKKGKKVFDESKKAVKDLLKISKKGDLVYPEITIAVDLLVGISEQLATDVIDDAQAFAGDKKVDKEIKKSDKEMDKAQKELDKGKPDKAIDKYKKAWEHAQKALKKKK